MTDWPLIAVRFALYADLGLVFGLPLFGLHALRGGEQRGLGLLRFAWLVPLLAIGGLALSALGFALMASSMAGTGIGELDPALVSMLAFETAPGWAFLARMAALAVAVLGAILFVARPTAMLALSSAAGAVALASLAWTGHAAAGEGAIGWIHLASDFLHLWAAGLWLGALGALTLMLFSATAEQTGLATLYRALEGFSITGTIAVGALVLSGVINALVLIGPANILLLPADLYGQLLIAKLALFLAMLALAATNRYRLAPALAVAIASAEPREAVAALRRSLAVETIAALAILALVGWLGTLSPTGTAG